MSGVFLAEFRLEGDGLLLAVEGVCAVYGLLLDLCGVVALAVEGVDDAWHVLLHDGRQLALDLCCSSCSAGFSQEVVALELARRTRVCPCALDAFFCCSLVAYDSLADTAEALCLHCCCTDEQHHCCHDKLNLFHKYLNLICNRCIQAQRYKKELYLHTFQPIILLPCRCSPSAASGCYRRYAWSADGASASCCRSSTSQ